MASIIHNPAEQRFETDPGGGGALALIEYRQTPTAVILVHTEVPEQFEGQGIGGALVKAAFDYARQQNLKVIPQCPFAAVWAKRHPEYTDLLA